MGQDYLECTTCHTGREYTERTWLMLPTYSVISSIRLVDTNVFEMALRRRLFTVNSRSSSFSSDRLHEENLPVVCSNQESNTQCFCASWNKKTDFFFVYGRCETQSSVIICQVGIILPCSSREITHIAMWKKNKHYSSVVITLEILARSIKSHCDFEWTKFGWQKHLSGPVFFFKHTSQSVQVWHSFSQRCKIYAPPTTMSLWVA